MPQMFKVNRRFFVQPVVLLQNVLDKSRVGSESGRDDAADVKPIGMAVFSQVSPDHGNGIAEKFQRSDQGFEAGNGGDVAGHSACGLIHPKAT